MTSLRETIAADRAAEPHKSDRLTVRIFRLGQAAKRSRLRAMAYPAYRAVDLLWTRLVVGAELPASVKAGPGLRLRHWGRGIILHPDARLGSGVTLYHRVTIGVGKGGVPTLGDNVFVSPGATITGGIYVGAGSKIMANAAVSRDIPPNSLVGGVPARVVKTLDT